MNIFNKKQILIPIVLTISLSILIQVDQAYALSNQQIEDKKGYESVLDSCNHIGDSFTSGKVFRNSTHYMDNHHCKFVENNMIKGPVGEDADKRVLDYQPNFIRPPLKLSQMGYAFEDILCNGDLVKVQKVSNNDTVCLFVDSVPKLIERGYIQS